ncbi:ATP-binding cassette sub-family G member 4 [Anopheles arabiensis]|uniref:AGAP009463-PA n=4 Tax=gambiae species complex TaxID=44542 RepID=Q7PFM9_ANOGA|nr:ATP-binding cassette sub-family G member 4 [Anopheles arabiensis]XP_040234500.1 ATP-binding cassette sub-family G member 4 [Anopheles coluzzii]XP_041777539.1 ATP-binding cassette sub-family G member 4 [Anopheles merus]XP_310233.4 ATP-binding cassette sub-family G member 4 [Anopheles gambiae]EAA45250.4 AGAP009463-PA [Anopheles gambiae str. PEST]
MDILQQEVRGIALANLSEVQSGPVYNQTTVPLNRKDSRNMDQAVIRNNTANAVSNHELRPFQNLPAREPVDIQFKDVSYCVSLGFRKGQKEILHNVNGKFPGSQLIAIMGPSGAGKSTLLDVLSGYRRTGVEGAVYVNGRIRNLNSFRRMTCYITQDDRLQTLLTVVENMRIAADLKLGPEVSRHEKESIVEDILTVLGLYNHQFTITKLLSGGQRKRLSIALELINNPTIMFLDEPTTGLDSSSCNQVVDLLKQLAKQGRTIICTIHQPSAKLFQEFDQVYVLSNGECMYQGCTNSLVPFLQSVDMPCPVYHNPADYVIELACGEYGEERIQRMVMEMGNGECTEWFTDKRKLLKPEQLRQKYPLKKIIEQNEDLTATSQVHQLQVLIKRGIIKAKRDATLTHLRIGVNIIIAAMLGFLFIDAGNEGSRVLDNYNLLFSILMHHMMATMMLTVLTFPTEMGVILKEHFNRWYTLKCYYLSVSIIDLPLSVFCCLIFTIIIYLMSGQPMEWFRFGMFFTISLLIVLIAQSIGLTIGAWFNVVNGTFLGPVLTIPMMMFAGFGVTLRDLPSYLKWGSHISYLRYGLEGYVNAIYGENRETLDCELKPYCHYRYPAKFLSEISMEGDQFWKDVYALCATLLLVRVCCYFCLRWKVISVR